MKKTTKVKSMIAYISALKEPRIISFSVVNMTEKLQCCQLDLGLFFNFLVWLERTVYKTKLGKDLFEGIIKRKKSTV